MKNRLLLIITCACIFTSNIFGQVDIDKSINLSGSTGNAKISGIKDVGSPQDALSVEAFQKGTFTYGGVSAGSSTAYTVSLSPPISGYVTGMILYYKAHVANGAGPVTINVNTQGLVTIKKNNGQDLAANDIAQNQVVCVVYDGANFNLLSRTEAVDQSATNELQTISGSGANDVTLSNSGGTISFAGTGLSTVTRSSNTFTINTNALANTVTGTGTPGYAARWATGSTINSSVVYDNGSNVGIGTTTVTSKLNISSPGGHLLLRRESTETTGGKMIFMELYQDDPLNAVPEIYPSIRFHHNNKYWNRIESRGDGIHFKAGSITDDTYYKILAGSAYFSGNVGINILSPGAKLTIKKDATDPGTHDDNKALFVSGNFNSGQSYDGGVEFRHDNLTQGIGFGYNTIYQTGTNADEILNLMAKGSGTLTLNAYGGGNVGVGTNSPGGKLHITGSTSGLTDYGMLTIGQAGVGVNTQPGLSFGYDLTNNWAWMYARTVGCCGRQININGTVFVASGGGNTGIGTNSPKAQLSVGSSDMVNIYSPADNYLAIQTTLDNQAISTYGTDSENRLALQNTVGRVSIGPVGTNITHILHISAPGRSTAANWATSSDERIKENVKDMPGGLTKIMALRPVSYDFKDEYLKHNKGYKKNNVGFIAQEVEKVAPNMVETVKEIYGDKTISDFRVLNLSDLNPYLVKAVQEQQAEIEKLKAEIRAIKEITGVGKLDPK